MEEIIPISNRPEYLTDVIPSSNLVSTASELSKFAEFLRLGGSLDGHRVPRRGRFPKLSSSAGGCAPTLMAAPSIRWATGFMLVSKRFGPFGTDAEHAFGNTGLTQIAIWSVIARYGCRDHQQRQAGQRQRRKHYATLASTINRALEVAVRRPGTAAAKPTTATVAPVAVVGTRSCCGATTALPASAPSSVGDHAPTAQVILIRSGPRRAPSTGLRSRGSSP